MTKGIPDHIALRLISALLIALVLWRAGKATGICFRRDSRKEGADKFC